jgi:anti-sigma B factor antagonist
MQSVPADDPTRRPTVIAPRGELDLMTSRDLGSRLQEAAGSAATAAIVDLTQISFVDSTGLGVLLKARERFLRRQVPLLFVDAPGGAFARMLAVAGLEGRIVLHPTREDALRSAGLAA